MALAQNQLMNLPKKNQGRLQFVCHSDGKKGKYLRSPALEQHYLQFKKKEKKVQFLILWENKHYCSPDPAHGIN